MSDARVPVIHLVILAGGRSQRARRGDSSAPKQFRQAGDRMLVMWSVEELLAAPGVASLTLIVPEPWQAVSQSALDGAGIAVPSQLATAGATRTDSTWNGLQRLAAAADPAADDLVAVHDAARPFATRHLLSRVAAAADRHGGAVPGVAVPDTIVRIDEIVRSDAGGGSGEAQATYLRREALQAVQTPQVFRWDRLFDAHRWCAQDKLAFTDDGGLLAARDQPPVVVMGEPENWKITTEGDWVRAESLLRRS